VLDLQGSKWRLGQFTAFEIREDEFVDLVYGVVSMQPNVLPVPHPDFFKAAGESTGEIILSDAKIRLSIEAIDQEVVKARVTQGGEISPGKGITLASTEFRKETLHAKDQTIFEQTKDLGFIRYALSYIRDAAEMARYREIFGPSAYLIAKLERKPAMEAALEIAEIVNELWICRGDLGAELGEQAMAEAVYRFSPLVRRVSIPVFMAGQVLEHMAAHSTPTRSEVCYLYETLMKGYRGFVLSDETAIGRYPVESCRSAALFKG
jgi:pyruvate kinase